MGKHTVIKNSGRARVRFVMLEADLADGEIGQITQAIQNALRSPAPPQVKRIAPSMTSDSAEPEETNIAPEVEETADVEVIDESLPSAKTRVARKPAPTPNVIDIDMKTDVSLKAFVADKNSDSQQKKYLIVAAWLKEHRETNGVTPDHIYTCFRSMEWSVGIPDFGQPLRNLKRKKFFSQNAKGEFEINHLGLDYVKNLGNGAD